MSKKMNKQCGNCFYALPKGRCAFGIVHDSPDLSDTYQINEGENCSSFWQMGQAEDFEQPDQQIKLKIKMAKIKLGL